MAVTTTYATAQLAPTQLVNVTTAANQWNPQAVLTGAGAVVFYADASVSGGRLLARALDAAGLPQGAETLVAAGVDASYERGYSVARLSNGDIAVVWATSAATPDIRFKVLSQTLATVIGETPAETSPAIARTPDVAALPGGGFALVWEKDWGAGDHDIAYRRFSAGGASSDDPSGVVVDGTGDKRMPSIAALSDGKLAFGYHEVTPTGTVAWRALLTGAGVIVTPPTALAPVGALNQKVDVIARADGGYLMSFESDRWTAGDSDIASARFGANGALQGVLRGAASAGLNVSPRSALSPEGFALVTNTSANGDYDSLGALISPSGEALAFDILLRGDGAGPDLVGYGGAQWLDASRILLTDITGDGTTGDGAGYAISATIVQLRRSTIGDDAANTIGFTADSLPDIIDGMGGDDLILGGAGDDVARGGAGNDTILGGAGNDTLFGDAGIDTIYAGAGDDFLQAGEGASSVLAGEAGNDQIYGGAGADYMIGGDGNDILVGLGGQDSLYGGAGDDYIVAGDGVGSVVDGGGGANTLWGASGNDYMIGGEGADLIVGAGGSDYQFGNAGNDTHYGGRGTDYIYTNAGNDFVWTDDVGAPQSTDYVYAGGGTGTDTIADFTPGAGANHDVLVVSPASGVTNFAQAQARMAQVGVYTVLTLGTDKVFLYNVQPFQLTAENFLFL